MKYWVDPPSGWMYGFPKVWDEDMDGPLPTWLGKEGYPYDEELPYVRMWPYEEVML
jgi:hypothetical protein